MDRRIYVVGFGLYGSIHGPCEYQATIQIIHTGSERLLGSSEVSFTSDGSNSTFRVMFKEPIEIQPNTNYTASATLKVSLNIFLPALKTLKYFVITGTRFSLRYQRHAQSHSGMPGRSKSHFPVLLRGWQQ